MEESQSKENCPRRLQKQGGVESGFTSLQPYTEKMFLQVPKGQAAYWLFGNSEPGVVTRSQPVPKGAYTIRRPAHKDSLAHGLFDARKVLERLWYW